MGIYATLGTCYSVWMTVRYAGWNKKKPSVVFKTRDNKTLIANAYQN
jgi:hypothetical protein